VQVRLIQVDDLAAAQQMRFLGSPTILIDGIDPFADDALPASLSCRLYRTPIGLAGSPSVQQLIDILNAASVGRDAQR
jgi:hypothetical protein